MFPGVVSNHHLHHLAALGIATAEMLEFGAAYADQIIKNAQRPGDKTFMNLDSMFYVKIRDSQNPIK